MHEIREVLFGYGHENVQATHRSTLEFTKDKHLSKNGDCILVVSMNKGISDLSEEFKEALRRLETKLIIRIEVENLFEEIQAQGSTQLILSHPAEMVIRKSNHISDRTLAIYANKAAKDISREIVEKLRNPQQIAKIILIAKLSDLGI